MARPWILLLGITFAIATIGAGCQSCSSCHDYAPPVANCDCNACGCHRAGSASDGPAGVEYAGEEYAEGFPEDAEAFNSAPDDGVPFAEEPFGEP